MKDSLNIRDQLKRYRFSSHELFRAKVRCWQRKLKGKDTSPGVRLARILQFLITLLLVEG